MEWGDNRWSLASTGGEIAHQLVGTQSSLPGITSPFQLPDIHPQSYSFADGQFHCRCIREQERGDQIPGAFSSSTGCLGISPGERLLDYGTTHSRVVERGGGCSIKMLQQQPGMDVTPRYFQARDQTVLPTISGRICLTNQPSSATVCLSPSTSRSNSDGCLSPRLEQVEKLDIPTGNLATKDTQPDKCGPSNSLSSSPTLAGTTMVPTTVGDAGGLPPTTSSASAPDILALRAREGTSASAQAAPNRLASICERYRSEGLSTAATGILLSSWSEATQKRYSGPWNT